MSDLTTFRDHCRAMSTAEHRVDCAPGRGQVCIACVTDTDRALWTRLADETDAYLARQPEPDLFGAEA